MRDKVLFQYKAIQRIAKQIGANRRDPEAKRKAIEWEILSLAELLYDMGHGVEVTEYRMIEYTPNFMDKDAKNEPLLITSEPKEVLVYLRELIEVGLGD